MKQIFLPRVMQRSTAKQSATLLYSNWMRSVGLSVCLSVTRWWFTAGGAICIAHYDVINDVITRKL